MAKLILDYTKVLVWPIVVLVAFFSFRGGIEELMKRTEKIDTGMFSAMFSGSTTSRTETDNKEKPQIWFDFASIDSTQTECLDRGTNALKANGFVERGINKGNTAYGYYDKKWVGTVSCMDKLDFVLISVSGPTSNIVPEKTTELKKSFQRTKP